METPNVAPVDRVAALLNGQPDPGPRKARREQAAPARAAVPAPAEPEAEPRAGADASPVEPGPDDAGQAEPEQAASEPDSEAAEAVAPVTIDDLADQLGLTRKELNSVTVQVGADTMTLGELKAKLPELAKLAGDRVKWETERDDWGLQRVDAQRRLEALISEIPREAVSPGLMQRLEAQYQETRQKEAALLVSARPEWGDPTHVAKQRERLGALAGKYGITRAELNAIVDHRQLLILDDFAKLQERLETAMGGAARRPIEGTPLHPTQTRAVDTSSNGTRRSPRLDRVGAVSKLLNARR